MIRALLRNRAGGSAVELALLAPMLSLGLLAAYDLSRGFSNKLDLVSAASRTAELASAPGVVRTSYGFLATEAVAAANKPGATAVVRNWLECGGTVQQPGTNLCAAGVGYARYVSVTVSAPYQPLFGYGGLIDADGIVLGSTATVRIQ